MGHERVGPPVAAIHPVLAPEPGAERRTSNHHSRVLPRKLIAPNVLGIDVPPHHGKEATAAASMTPSAQAKSNGNPSQSQCTAPPPVIR